MIQENEIFHKFIHILADNLSYPQVCTHEIIEDFYIKSWHAVCFIKGHGGQENEKQ